MAAKIYSPPSELGEPETHYGDWEKHQSAEAEYIKKVQAWALKNGSGNLCGEIFRYPVGDGCAQYVVLKSSPLTLIHLPVGDAWHIPAVVARGLRLQDLKDDIQRSRSLGKLFGEGR